MQEATVLTPTLHVLVGLIVVLSFSRMWTVIWCRSQDLLSWISGHSQAFARLGGIAWTWRYENVPRNIFEVLCPSALCAPRAGRRASPHIFRHTAAVHLLEAGVEVNVIRGWLGHADLTTTNRYAEINTKAKLEALRYTEPPGTSEGSHHRPVWRTDESLLTWLSSL